MVKHRLNSSPSLNSRSRKPTTAKTRRWWLVLCAFTDHGMRNLSPGAITVWFVLFRNSHDSIVRMSLVQIAQVTGIQKRTVQRKLAELIDEGYADILVHGGRNRGPSHYLVRAVSVRHPCRTDVDSQDDTRVVLNRSDDDFSGRHQCPPL